ncbi:MAG: RsmB/NOP family class I SAM-dependent RNA methyltransferase [Rhodospirillales bacterium]|jgi:16S rRNA (cytosine967-C5)-methyltransferase|nr:RsmB/NOP family class I SAM-dependent RNA methyltransferase [Rhodospirillales bacterium]MBT4039717.1 RsmB/NOP family class I SAM-dependent RNA methyltransferase [Rhodospirillales bacterium]MBT4626166.1 RsmB/NOP family class I SAM-dependent RNA methyltransferase [Rhodospirillales bacterium]MBT5350268.1 RsmB/NOP family class I SAM-dependent RNA methyltransferase [Rhodospirillales bacterium]MBT5522306.1 RsmB/NOP family class I SAM-dependent RNA methyltransferase [Rhodospirillales bacterium]
MNDKPAKNSPKSDAARIASLHTLNAVLRENASFDEALDAGRKRLKDPRDRGFQFHLVMTTLRHLGEINMVMGKFLTKQPKGRAKAVVGVLQLGIAQVLYMDVPGFAAASTSVDLVRKVGFSGHAKLVNAIMRKVVADGPGLIEHCDAPRTNTPGWLWESWIAAYGNKAARKIATAHATEPLLDITVKSDAEGWAERLGAEILPTGTLRLNGAGAIEDMDGYGDGQWWVQDAGAAIPARLLGDVTGMRVADLCAAPGGKTAQLASRGAHVTALDKSAQRLERLSENMKRLSLDVGVVAADVNTWTPDSPLDAVLLDAPCSATGTIRRHPDVTLNKSMEDVRSLAKIQTTLLNAAVQMVRPGGTIVYCVCSLQPEEGPDQITALLENRDDVKLSPVTADEIPGLGEALGDDGTVRILPSYWLEQGGIDGFFVARLQKI